MFSLIVRLAMGLGVFLVGMWVLRKGLAGVMGRKTRELLSVLAPSPVKAAITGTLVTAILQSSSAVTVMVVGLVSAGVLDLYQAFGIVIGANVGTTVTAQIISFKVEAFWQVLAVPGLLLWLLGVLLSNHMLRGIGSFTTGFAAILCGINMMEGSLGDLSGLADIYRVVSVSSRSPLLAVAIGAALTGLIQSSSAVTALVIALTRMGIVGLVGGVALVLGSNVGTCVTTLLAGTVASFEGKAIALAHLLFNLLGVVITLPFLGGFLGLVALTASDPGRQIANAHALFNIFSAICILPFSRLFMDAIVHMCKGRWNR